MKKKMKRFQSGGGVGDDVRTRAMKSVEGLEGIKGSDIEDEAGMVRGSIKRNEYGDLYDSEMKAAPKTVSQKRTKLPMPDYSNEDLDRMGLNSDIKPVKSSVYSPKSLPESDREENSAFMRQFRKDEAKEKSDKNYIPEKLRSPNYKAPSVVKNVSKEVTKPTPRSASQMIKDESEYAMKPTLQSKGERLIKSMGLNFKSGGKVSSASKRADGCAIRGKTRA
jgi:hypothetical protein